MPPNRQAVANVIRSLSFENVSDFVTDSKYAPLTLDAPSSSAAIPAAPSKAAAVERQRKVEVKQQEQADEGEEQQQQQHDGEIELREAAPQHADEAEEQKQRQVARIEDLLKKESVRIKIHSHSPPVEGRPQKAYWQWDTLTPEEEKRRMIDKILDDERARDILSTSRVQANLQKAEAPSPPAEGVRRDGASSDRYWSASEPAVVRAPHTSDSTHPSNSYWDWSPPTSPEEVRRGVLDRVLADEEARHTLSAAHTQEVMEAEAECHAAMESERWNNLDLGMEMGCDGGCYWDT